MPEITYTCCKLDPEHYEMGLSKGGWLMQATWHSEDNQKQWFASQLSGEQPTETVLLEFFNMTEKHVDMQHRGLFP